MSARINPFARVGELSRADVERAVDAARRLMRASALQRPGAFSVYVTIGPAVPEMRDADLETKAGCRCAGDILVRALSG